MPPSLRPNTARPESGFAPVPEPVRAIEPRSGLARPGEARTAPTLRFPDDGRRAGEGLRLEAGDRIVIPSGLARDGKREGSLLRAIALAALFFLAAIGALSLYQGYAQHLLP